MKENYLDLTQKQLEAELLVRVKDRYAEPHRRMHNIDHVNELMKKLRKYNRESKPKLTDYEFKLLTITIYYHDVVFNAPVVVKSYLYASNEALSSLACYNELVPHVRGESLDMIIRLIISTDYFSSDRERILSNGSFDKLVMKLADIMHDIENSVFTDISLAKKLYASLLTENLGETPDVEKVSRFYFFIIRTLPTRICLDFYKTAYYQKYNDLVVFNILELIKFYTTELIELNKGLKSEISH